MSYLLRERYREGKKVKHMTIANLSRMPKEQIEQIEEIAGEKWYYMTTITKPQIKELMKKDVFQYELFDNKLCEVEDKKGEGIRYILKKNPFRAEEIKRTLNAKLIWFTDKTEKQNEYLVQHPRATAAVALKNLKALQKQRALEKFIEIGMNAREIICKRKDE